MDDRRLWCFGCWGELPAAGASACPRCGRPYDPGSPEGYYTSPHPITVFMWVDLHIPFALLCCVPFVVTGHLMNLWVPAVVGLLMLTRSIDPRAFREGRAREGTWKIGVNVLLVALLCGLMAAVIMAVRS